MKRAGRRWGGVKRAGRRWGGEESGKEVGGG